MSQVLKQVIVLFVLCVMLKQSLPSSPPLLDWGIWKIIDIFGIQY